MKARARGRRARTRRATIGLLAGWQVYGGTLHSFLGPLLRAIEAAAEEQDCNLLLACGAGSDEEGIAPPWPLDRVGTQFVPVGPWNTDGLLVVTPFISVERAKEIEAIAAVHPVVFIGPAAHGGSVAPDNASGISAALEHLRDHGHRRIAFISHGSDFAGDGAERLQAYELGVRRLGLDADPRLIRPGYHLRELGANAVAELVRDDVGFTAVVASNDESAQGVLDALRAADLRVPADVALVGFDDRLEALSSDPALTTVRYPFAEIGRRALEVVRARIRGEAVDDVRVPVRLVIRESCGCRWERDGPGEASRRALATQVVERTQLAEHFGVLARGLLSALDEQRVVDVLTESLPELGMPRGNLLFLEGDDDPVRWSRLAPPAGERPCRFESRSFPPAAIVPPGEAFRLALFPVAAEHRRGYLVFDAHGLEPCATVARQVAAALRSERVNRSTEHLPQPGGRNVLVVDDDCHTRAALVRLLEDNAGGYELQLAGNGAEALATARRENVDLVILDLTIPGEPDGYAVLEELRATRETPVIVLTAGALAEDDLRRLEGRANSVLHKDMLGPAELTQQIARALDQAPPLGGEARRIAWRAMVFVHARFAEPISRPVIARHIGVSEDYLTRCFRREAGISLRTYLQRYRIAQAKRLVATSGQNLGQIALTVGFTDYNSFGRLFQREVGVSPRAYRSGARRP